MITDVHMAGRVMKVNHAGEQGAICIYAGQIFMARFTAKSLLTELRTFKAHEEGHRAIFQNELERRGLLRCRSYWLCAVGGYALGIATGLLGARAISLTTVAVERVVLRHLWHQIDFFADDVEAISALSAILKEEQEHHDQAATHGDTCGVVGWMFSGLISGATESVIWLGMRL